MNQVPLPLALITGGTSGIGLAAAETLKKTHQLALIYKSNQARADDAVQKLGGPKNCKCWQINLESDEAVSVGMQAIFTHYGLSPSVLVNGAGAIEGPEFFVQQKNLHLHQRLMNLNYFGSLRMIHEVLPGMYREKRGCIVNLSSISAEGGIKGFSAYSCSKIALESLTKNLAIEAGHRGVSINCIRPGLTLTPLSEPFLERTKDFAITYNPPLGRVITPEEVAKTIFHIIEMSPTINGQVITVDGGCSTIRSQSKINSPSRAT